MGSKRSWLDKYFDDIKRLYPGLKTIYGPYNNSEDGRTRIVLYDDKKRTAKQYCRVKMELKLKRRLTDDETVDHDDGDILNDKYTNLIVRTRKEHVELDVRRRNNDYESECRWCGSSFKPNMKQVRDIRKVNPKAGPFCSRSCTGKYGAYIQGGGKPLDRQKFSVVYYTNKKKKTL